MKRHIFYFSIIAVLIGLITPLLSGTQPVSAANAADFKAGNIIDDAIFFNSAAMNPTQIQSFLNAKVTSCDTNGLQTYSAGVSRAAYGASRGYPPPYVCLKDFSQATPTKAAESGLCNQYNGGTKTAAQIIYDVSQACGINPQVLLVVLQKEQSLISDDWPWSIQYRSATGFGCPDTAPCDSEYYGFFNQVYHGARIYKKYARDSHQFNYRAGRNNNILYNPNTACGSSSIFLNNQSTAGLYNYTPYQPNAAALNNLYGTGDGCSAYGNRNFWRMFTDWFGNTNFPLVIKTQGSNSIYLQANGYKFYIPSISILNEFGLNSGPQMVDTATFNSIPFAHPSNGHSTSIGTVVKSISDSDEDGGSIYLVTGGRKHLFRTVQQMADFGYDSSDIVYLPLPLINSLPSDGALSNYIQIPGSSFFQVSEDTKRLITDSATFSANNTEGSFSLVSEYLVNQIPSASPLAVNPIMLSSTLGTTYLYTNGSYYYITSPEVLDCWNFGSNFSLYVYKLPNNSYIAPVNDSTPLKCGGVDSVNDHFVIDKGKKVAVPGSFGFTKPSTISNITPLIDSLPVRPNPLARSIKASNAASVWYAESGTRKPILSMLDLAGLGISPSSIDIINSNAVNTLPTSGVKLSVGAVVKAQGGSTIFVITSDNQKKAISTPESFVAYSYGWNEVRTVNQSVLDAAYTTISGVLSSYLYTSSGGIYLMDSTGCYGLTASQATAFGTPLNAEEAGQTYSSSIFPNVNLARCTYGSIYIKSTTSNTVYRLTNGTKHPISSWAKLQELSQQNNPYVISLSSRTVTSFATGNTL